MSRRLREATHSRSTDRELALSSRCNELRASFARPRLKRNLQATNERRRDGAVHSKLSHRWRWNQETRGQRKMRGERNRGDDASRMERGVSRANVSVHEHHHRLLTMTYHVLSGVCAERRNVASNTRNWTQLRRRWRQCRRSQNRIRMTSPSFMEPAVMPMECIHYGGEIGPTNQQPFSTGFCVANHARHVTSSLDHVTTSHPPPTWPSSTRHDRMTSRPADCAGTVTYSPLPRPTSISTLRPSTSIFRWIRFWCVEIDKRRNANYRAVAVVAIRSALRIGARETKRHGEGEFSPQSRAGETRTRKMILRTGSPRDLRFGARGDWNSIV